MVDTDSMESYYEHVEINATVKTVIRFVSGCQLYRFLFEFMVEFLAYFSKYEFKTISDRVDRASATESVDSSSIPGQVKPKTIKEIGIHSFPA